MLERIPRKVLGGAVGIAAVIAIAVYGLVDPTIGFFPKCIIRSLTGLNCPGCGSQRALHSLLHGDAVSAFRYNAFLVSMLPYLGALGVASLIRDNHPRPYRVLTSQWIITLLIIAVIAWFIFRNLCLPLDPC